MLKYTEHLIPQDIPQENQTNAARNTDMDSQISPATGGQNISSDLRDLDSESLNAILSLCDDDESEIKTLCKNIFALIREVRRSKANQSLPIFAQNIIIERQNTFFRVTCNVH